MALPGRPADLQRRRHSNVSLVRLPPRRRRGAAQRAARRAAAAARRLGAGGGSGPLPTATARGSSARPRFLPLAVLNEGAPSGGGSGAEGTILPWSPLERMLQGYDSSDSEGETPREEEEQMERRQQEQELAASAGKRAASAAALESAPAAAKAARVQLPSFRDRGGAAGEPDRRPPVSVAAAAPPAVEPRAASAGAPSRGVALLPPQVRSKGLRKNVSTEDHSQWNTQATAKAIEAAQQQRT